MYKLIIIDDEERVRKGLKLSVDWEEINIEIVGEAKNGEIGLELIKKEKPEIIITDIYMPKIDGLELIQRAEKIVPGSKFIILSGYDEFNLVQTAIRNKAFDYLLKPVKVEDMIKVINKAQKKIDKERNRLANEQKLKKQLKDSLPALKERYLNYLLNNRISLSKINRRYKYLNLNLKKKNFVVLVIGLKDIENYGEEEMIQLKKLQIKNLLNKYLNQEFCGEVIEGYPDKFILIINYDDKFSKEDIVEKIQNIVKEFKKTVTGDENKAMAAGIGRLYKRSEFISNSYQEALEALEYRLFPEKDNVIFIEDVDVTGKKEGSIYPFNLEDKIIMALKTGDIANIKKYTGRFYDFFTREAESTPADIKRATLQLGYLILKKQIEWNISTKIIKTIEKTLEITVKNANSLTELKKFINNFLLEIAKEIKERQIEQDQSHINRTKEFIQNNYSQDLTLKDIAKVIYITPNYLANLFKNKTGKTVISYLTEVRIEEARRLLLETPLKVYQIAEKVGYHDSKYFSQVFKKQVGITPNEYRNTI